MANLKIGTSGWSYRHWKELFYPAELSSKNWLKFYSRHFDTIEINSSFYRLPKRETFENWAKITPDKFLFSVKASRFITHIKRLKNCEEPLKNFFTRVLELGEKLGPILFQLPPNLKKDSSRLNDFLKILPAGYRYVFEFRNDSWFDDQTFDALRENNCALCIASSPIFPYVEKLTADFTFIRMHGGTILYGSKYNKDELEDWAKKIKSWLKDNIDCYIYFNNDAFAHAVENAGELKLILEV
jgi:uncharacterized protein YecE (DUF72 family)